MTGNAADLVKDLLTAAANTELPESPETYKSGIKRFLTPSPQTADNTVFKRTRQFSNDSFTGSMDQHWIVMEDVDAEPVMQTHYLSRPMNPSDITQIAIELKALMLPEMTAVFKTLIQETQPDFASLLDGAVKKIQVETIALKKENASLKQENKTLKKQVGELKSQVSKVAIAADSNEQYSRRNNLRISGIPITENENTDDIVLQLANAVGVNLNYWDIDRSHRVGQMKSGTRTLIVKFTSYRARQHLYAARKKLRDTEAYKNTYINEDITARRSKILFAARSLVRAKKLKAAYSSDGKLFLRDNNDEKYHVAAESDLDQFKNLEPRPADDDDEDQWDDAVGTD